MHLETLGFPVGSPLGNGGLQVFDEEGSLGQVLVQGHVEMVERGEIEADLEPTLVALNERAVEVRVELEEFEQAQVVQVFHQVGLQQEVGVG